MRTTRDREVRRALYTREVRENVTNHVKVVRNGKATTIYNGSQTGLDSLSTTQSTALAQSSASLESASESTNENFSWQRANGSHFRDSQVSEDTFNVNLAENLDLRSSTPINTGQGRSNLRNGSPPHDIVAFYRRFGDWWNIFPKTDYSYSSHSPWYGREVAPGIPVIPNLSRLPLHGSATDISSAMRNRSSRSSFQNSQNTETSFSEYHKSGVFNIQNSETSYWETIVKSTRTTVTTTVTIVTAYVSKAVTKMRHPRTFLPIFLIFAFALMAYLLSPQTEKDGLNLGDTSISHVIAPYTKIFEYFCSFFTSTFYLLLETMSMLPIFVYQTFFSVTNCLLPSNAHKPLINQKVESSLDFRLEETRKFVLQILQEDRTSDKENIKQMITEVVYQVLGQKGYSYNQSLEELKQSFEGKLKNIEEKIETQVPSSNSAEIQTKDTNSALSMAVFRQEIQQYVESAINKYHADQTGLPDFALSSFGGQILKTKCTYTYTKQRGVYTLFGYSIADVYNSPDIIIKPGTIPGECWAFEGSEGCVVIKLALPIIVNAVTMEHTPKELTHYGDIKSAPKVFSVSSLKDEDDETPDVLGRFTYLDNQKSLQTFQTKISEPTEIIELKIESNHGHPDYTCLYRFRVHGTPVQK